MYRKADEVREREEGDKLLLYHTRTRELALLEGIGKAVWMLLPEMSLAEIEAKLLEFHPEDPEKVKTHLSAFIDDLVTRKFLVAESTG